MASLSDLFSAKEVAMASPPNSFSMRRGTAALLPDPSSAKEVAAVLSPNFFGTRGHAVVLPPNLSSMNVMAPRGRVADKRSSSRF